MKGLGSGTGAKGPKVTLVDARKAADRFRAVLAAGNDPILEDKKQTTLFGDYADRLLKKLSASFRHPKTEKNWKLHLTVHARSLRQTPVAAIGSADIAAVMAPLAAKPETARQLRGRIETVLRHARTDGLRSGENPASREALSMPRRKKNSVRHHPAMPYEQVPAFLAGLDPAVGGHLPLKLLILSATRGWRTTVRRRARSGRSSVTLKKKRSAETALLIPGGRMPLSVWCIWKRRRSSAVAYPR